MKLGAGIQVKEPNQPTLKTFASPWSRSLKIISTLATILLLSIVATLSSRQPSPPAWLALLPISILAGCGLFTVRGYALTPDALLVQRLLWASRVPLSGLQSAEHVPNAMDRSIRTFGNGGMYSFTGRFRNHTLGAYRAYVTDLNRTVVLRFPGRTVVISPGEPEAFVAELKAMKGLG